MATKKTGVPPPVIAAVKAWASAADPAVELAAQRRALDPLLVPPLVTEIAEVTAEQLLIALDMPSANASDDGPEVDFLGLPLSQTQAKRVAVWLEEQAPTATALGLTPEVWSTRLSEGFATAIAGLQGKGGLAANVAERLGADPLASASKGFSGGADPRTSPAAGLRGMLAARDFAKKKP
jgi:hypothetical protein